MSSLKNDPVESAYDRLQKRITDEIDGNPAMMDLFAETSGEITFETWADTLGLDQSAVIYSEIYNRLDALYSTNPDAYPANRAELREMQAAADVLAAAGWTAGDAFAEHYFALDEAVSSVFAARAEKVNMEGPAKQVAFLLANGVARDDIVKLFADDSPTPS